jgi:CHASE3 domain sensor protein
MMRPGERAALNDAVQSASPLLCWDHPDNLGLASKPWFKEQPQYKSLFDQASAINEGKLTKMNKAGKVEVAKQFIAAHQAAMDRHTKVEANYLKFFEDLINIVQVRAEKLQLEEAQARAAAGGGGCCVVL